MNRLLLLIFILTFSLHSFSQITSEIVQLNLGDSAHFDEVSIEFIALISDSRCPKDVQCIRAGEAIILVAVYQNGTLLNHKKLIFYPSGGFAKNMLLYSSENLNIQGFGLLPYPKAIGKISNLNYYLELAVN